jgi:3-hydroxyisobutyrate dehydrogenase-like beta-hydroxyacid dehydrogenase
VGGDTNEIEEYEGALTPLAARIVRVGPSGWGNVVKLLNNMMFGAINAATAEVFVICRAFGMSPKVFYDTVANSGAATVSGLFKESGSKIVSRNFDPIFAIDLLQKDMMLGIDMARRLGVPLLVSESNQHLNEMAKALKLGKEDSSAVIKVYERFLALGDT